MGWLIITEKDNTARRISSILFKDVKKSRKNGINIYYSKEASAYVVGLRGHIIQLDFPEEYNNWSKIPLESLLKAEIKKNITEKKIVDVLRELAKKVDRVTIATDFDREGELIGVEALEIIKEVNPKIKFDRARYSAITPADIKKAFSNLKEVDFNLAKSAETRQKIDLIWGAVLTRLISVSSGRMGKEFLSVGRVQSPTLRLIVERENEIKNFKPQKYWEIFADFIKDEELFTCKLDRRFDSKESALNAYNNIRDRAIVKKFEKRKRNERPPIPFNTTEFLREASRFMSPNKAMNVAESLYMSGYISYPRTDNTVYPPTINLKGIVKRFLNSDFEKEAKLVLSQERLRATRGKVESQDHPPIYPTAVARKDKLSKDEWIIYELVVRRFLATLSPDAIWIVKKGELDAGEVFSFSAKQILDKGWREVYHYHKPEEYYVPDLVVGEEIEVVDKRIEEKATKPPGRYSTGNLIAIMEKLGLGTKSTRHEIINKLYSRKYVFGNPLKPTEIAFAVISALKDSAEEITTPEMTSKLEKDMDKIAEGSMSDREVISESVQFLERILANLDRKALSQKLREGVRKDKMIGKCPICSKELIIRKSRENSRRFVGCTGFPECNFTLPLPQKGTIYITSKKCDKHGINKIKIRTKKGYWDLGCVYCNYLEWQNSKKK
jgi:DNA topoisomerase-1